MRTLGELLPQFSVELQDLVSSAGRPDLALQVPKLPIVERCTCGDSNCAHFYTAARSPGPYGAGHLNLVLASEVGFLALDVVADAIVAVEVLDRPDVKALLDAALPVQLSDRSAALACPACGFLTVPDSYYGSYAICGVCDWEDDGVQLANPACGGGANHESLIDAQRAALGRFPLAVAEAAGFRRSPTWRPLNEMEVAVASAERDEKYWRNQALSLPQECYWTRGA
jgi:hypothetical protein